MPEYHELTKFAAYYLKWRRCKIALFLCIGSFFATLGITIFAYVNAPTNAFDDMTGKGWIALHHTALAFCIVLGIASVVLTVVTWVWHSDEGDLIDRGRRDYSKMKSERNTLSKKEKRLRASAKQEIEHLAYLRKLEVENGFEPTVTADDLPSSKYVKELKK